MNRTKNLSTPTRSVGEGWYDGRQVYSWIKPGTSDTITYQLGPQWSSGRCNWKDCVHVSTGKSAGSMGIVTWSYDGKIGQWHPHYNYTYTLSNSIPSYGVDESVYNGIVDQIDLNTKDSVLLYSGIIQAIPLVGGALKFSSILNSAARKLKRDLRRMPFTTAVKQLIQADFVDRFVIKPTIADARMFADATNYVLRVIDTAYKRNQAPFALKSSVTTNMSTTQYSGRMRYAGYCTVDYDYKEVVNGTTTAFALLSAEYDTAAISPIKLWAARCGLTTPLESAWDLVPFSFVIDWFSGASEFILGAARRLADQDALRGRITDVHGLYVTTLAKREYTWKGTGVRDTYSDFLYYQPGTQYYTSTRFERFALKDPWGTLIRRAQDSIPLVRWDLSTTRMRTALELVVQKFLR